jgi:hypothetical protein
MYAISDDPSITTAHVRALHGLLLETTCLVPPQMSSSEGVLHPGAARAAVQGQERSAPTVRKRIRRGCRDLQVLICNKRSVREVPPLRTGEDVEETGPPSGWEAVVLIGEIERAVRDAPERRAARKAGTSILGTDMIRRIWRTAARWGVREAFDIRTPNPDPALPDLLFDRLLEALLWRLPMPPGTAFGSADQRAALQKRLGSRPGAQETQSALPDLVRDWKRCCRMASDIQQTGLSLSGRDRTPDRRPESEGSATARPDRSSEPGGSKAQRPEGSTDPKPPGATRRPLQGSSQGRGAASGIGIYQSLRAIDQASRAPEADLRQDQSKAALRVLIERGAQSLLREQTGWASARKRLFPTP